MKKILSKILLILLIVIYIYSFIFTTQIFTNDELWNFQNVYKLHNGYILYEDINAITPPLFFYLGYIILSIFSFTIVGFRIYNLLIYATFIFIIFKILKELNISNNLIPIYLTFIILFLTQNIIAGANYTILAMLFFMIGMYLYISKKSNNIFQGLLIYFCIFTKQNIGIFYVLSVLVYELINNKKFNFEYIKNQFIKFFIFLIPTSITFLHLYLIGSFNGFLSYCIGGMFEFSSNFIFIVPAYLFIIILIAIVLFIIVKLLKKQWINIINEDFFYNMNILFIFLLGSLSVTYPIFNSSHVLYVIPFALIIIFYFLDTLIFKELFNTNNVKKIVSIISCSIILLISIRNFTILAINKANYHYYDNNSTPYSHLYIPKELYLKFEKIKKFILEEENNGKVVKILAYDAALPMVELKKSNGKYDLFFAGNLGYNGINNSINEIKNSKNTIYLLFTDESEIFDQEPLIVRNYIIDNLNYKGTICHYSIYESN